MRFLLGWALCVCLISLPTSASEEGQYSVYDDATWAVLSSDVTFPYRRKEYESFMDACRSSAGKRAYELCDRDESHRMHMNMYQPRSVRNYTQVGFKKIRAPDAVYRLVKEFWDNNKDSAIAEWSHSTPYHNIWEAPTSVIRIDNSSLIGGGQHLYAAIADAARDAMEAWTGQPESSTSVYGIRIYHNQSILTPHVDRLPLVSSAILNVDQDVDEPWILEVYDHQGRAHNVSMDAGDLVLYESHSIIHGRPFRMHGKFYANIFIHFEPLGLPLDMPDDALKELDVDLPPYIIPGSNWEKEWRELNPDGWKLMKDPITLVQRGELRTLKYIGKLNPDKLHETDGTAAEWMPIHEAVRSGHLEILKYLIEEGGADMNQIANVGEGMYPVDLAWQFLDENHPVLDYLESIGAKSIHDDVEDEL